MKLLNKLLIFLLVDLVVVLLALFAVNSFDEPLLPEIKAFTERSYKTVPKPFIQAYKYALGFGAPQDTDPLVYGEEAYYKIKKYEQLTSSEKAKWPTNDLVVSRIEYKMLQPHCQKAICSFAEVNEFYKDLEPFAHEVQLLKKRFRKLIGFGGLVVDLKPSMFSLNISSIDFLRANRLMMLELSSKLYRKKVVEAVVEALKIRSFFVNSISHPNSLLFSMVSLAIIKDCNNFLEVVSKAFPSVKSYLNSLPQNQKNLTLSANDIIKLSQEAEFMVIAGGFQQIRSLEDLQLAPMNLGRQGDALLSWFVKNSKWLVNLFLKRNETINLAYLKLVKESSPDCLKSKILCSLKAYDPKWYSYLRNPFGKKMLEIVSFQYRDSYRKIHKSVQEINRLNL